MTQLASKPKHASKLSVLLLGAALSVVLAGCGNTLNGAKQDAATDSQKAADATDQAAAQTGAAVRKAGAAVANAPKDIAEAAVITPEVKTSVIRDPVLNDLKNRVDVATANGIVTLKGHVATASMKQRATEDAQSVLDKHHDTYKINNELVVSAPAP